MNNIITILLLLTSLSLFSQSDKETIVTEQTIKVSGNKDFYFAFAEGDKIKVDLKIVKGKNIKEFEIIEYPNTSKLFEFKFKEINKEISISKNAIMVFRIKGGGIGGKICKLKISRIPKDGGNIELNTSVKWESKFDSTYTTKYKKELIKIDTAIRQRRKSTFSNQLR